MRPLVEKLLARQRRFWHCLTGMLSGHRAVDRYSKVMNRHFEMGCTCGRTFWTLEGP